MNKIDNIFPKNYDFAALEQEVYAFWGKHNCFNADFKPDGTPQQRAFPAATSERAHQQLSPAAQQRTQQANAVQQPRQPYSIVLPPPNITGRLHMGHALNATLQDMLIRYKRMCDFDVLWVPGTDHAGIATQTVVRKMLDAKGIDYRTIGRAAFKEHVLAWKKKYGGYIVEQFKHLGCSFDESRMAFTMDPAREKAVTQAFIRLYKEGLIYKGRRIVNWCPIDRTALADDEVEIAPGGEAGFLYDILYPFVEKNTSLPGLVVSTTRPETLFGDVAVAVHPQDKRYQAYIGAYVKLPLTQRVIPIIADSHVERDFASGCLKITPAHDKDDFAIGERHQLPLINTMHENATMNDAVPTAFQGLSREACRKKVLATVTEQGLLMKETPHRISLGRSYRSKAVIEYRLSEQWFIKMKQLAKKLLQAPESLQFYPQRSEKVYVDWLHNIEDWCISRQIWWGHQLPAWIHQETGAICVGEDETTALKDVPPAERRYYRREEDVLDTWFSSALWPFSTLGWPNVKKPDFKRYFPTATLSTAKDIIFFWVARMALLSYHFLGKQPFTHVYIHPTILDHKGHTMSKSKGNGIDPYHIIKGATVAEIKNPIIDANPPKLKQLLADIEKQYKDGFPGVGADALRYTLLYLLTSAQSLQLSMKDFLELGRRFTTKFWNSARLIFLTIDQWSEQAGFVDFCANFSHPIPAQSHDLLHATQNANLIPHVHLEDVWISLECHALQNQFHQACQKFDFSVLGAALYKLSWTNFCDHYLEMIKLRRTPLAQPNETTLAQQLTTLKVLLQVLRYLLILAHPITPFITEYIWGKLDKFLAERKLSFLLPAYQPLITTPFLQPHDFSTLLHQLPRHLSPAKLTALFTVLKRLIGHVRALRKRYNIHYHTPLTAELVLTPAAKEFALFFHPPQEQKLPPAANQFLTSTQCQQDVHRLLCQWVFLNPVPTLSSTQRAKAITLYDEAFTLQLDVSEHVNWDQERQRLRKEQQTIIAALLPSEKRLKNKAFCEKAAPALVKSEHEKTHRLRQTLAAVEKELTMLASAAQ